MPRTATAKLADDRRPKKVVLDKDFAGIKAGQRMLVGTPQMIDDYIRAIPSGEGRTIIRMRRELARREGCDAACPVSTGIFLRIVAEAALEALADGSNIDEVTPFWRVVSSKEKLAQKLDIDPAWLDHQREREGINAG